MFRSTLTGLLLVCIAGHIAWAGTPADPLEARFQDPVDADKPWAYWWWVNGNVDEPTITRDLEALKQQGFGGLLMFDSRNYHDDLLPPPPPRMPFMSSRWRSLMRHSIAEARRLGLQMSVNLSSGAGALKGPWDVGDNAPKKLIWTAADISGGRQVRCILDRADRRWEIALLAVRHEAPGQAEHPADEVKLSGPWHEVAAAPKSPKKALEIVDLSARVDGQGQLAWDAPPGRWRLIRFAFTVMEGHETDVDILSSAAVEAYFNRMAGAFLEDAGAAAGRTLTHLYSVSWEGAVPSWTFGLEDEFRRYRGYDMRPWLAVLAGMTVQSPELSQRFERDYYRTLSDCFLHNCYGKLEDLTHAAGLRWHSESGGPWDRKLPSFRYADQLAFLGRNDMPQGEFWYPYRGLNRPPAMAGHIYGKPVIATEAFTHMKPHWTVYPAILKPGADAAFCDGINQFIWHTFTASPAEYGKPGIEYFAGSHLNPNVTWFAQSHAFIRYLARCQTMLRQGRFVADVCCYVGDQPYQHWGRGERWSTQATLTLGKGYSYDIVSSEVLLERLSVKDGRLVLPDGMSYGVLVVDLDDHTASPRVLRRILELARSGATVVLGDRRPDRAPGLRDHPACDAEVRRLADEIWGEEPGARSAGQGQLITGTEVDAVLRSRNTAPDYEGPWDYTHRRSDEMDIYFLSGEGDADCTFRVAGKEPELWDPQTGQARPAVCYRQTPDGRTIVPIHLPRDGSIFVVFRSPARQPHITAVSSPPDRLQIVGRIDGDVTLHCWQNGEYELATSAGAAIRISVSDVPAPLAIAGPWQVRFTPGWGAPESVVFDRLIAWNEHADPGIRFYSGTGVYHATFDLDARQAGGLVRLRLGEVHHIAEVRLNGKALGVVWTDPWTVDLTGVVKTGTNKLEIDVINTWVNRLIGDAGLPIENRYTKTNVTGRRSEGKHPHLSGYSPNDPLLKSGLIGPVHIEFGMRRDAKLNPRQ